MFDISPIQLIIVLVIAVLVLGPTKLPEFTRTVGKGIRDFKDTISGDGDREAPAPVTTATAGPAEEPTASPDVLEGIVVSGDAPPAGPRRADGPPPAG